MADPPASDAHLSSVTEKTFSSYNRDQGKAYASARRDYNPFLYQTVIDHHKSTGGQLDTVLDVGCGPGLAVRALAKHFTHAVGLDPSSGMIATAQSLGGVAAGGEPIRFELSTAEDLGLTLSPAVGDSTIDLITASNAAHWFDMPRFWLAAARVLKPGGSVAIWTSGEIRAHPSVPNAAAIQAAIDEHLDTHVKQFYTPGNLLVRGRYVGLPLPWTLEDPVRQFDEGSFFRKEWEVDEEFFVGEPEVDLDMFEKMISTGSAQTRWRQAHPEAVGTEHDVVRMLRRKIERLLHEAGVDEGKEKVRGAVQGVLLMVKKIPS